MTSELTKVLDSTSAPCDKCELRYDCSEHMLCCPSMRRFITTGVETQRSEPPTSSNYDAIFGRQAKESGIRVMTRSEFMANLTCNSEDKTTACNNHLIRLYEASTGKSIPEGDDSMFLEWDWMFVTGGNPSILMGAIGYDRTGQGVYVSYLYVRDFYKGMGIGSQLLSRVESYGNRVLLFPEDDNAQSWYEHKGYQRSEYKDNIWIKEKEVCQPSIL